MRETREGLNRWVGVGISVSGKKHCPLAFLMFPVGDGGGWGLYIGCRMYFCGGIHLRLRPSF